MKCAITGAELIIASKGACAKEIDPDGIYVFYSVVKHQTEVPPMLININKDTKIATPAVIYKDDLPNFDYIIREYQLVI